jgi:hypothetical protein
MKWPQSVECEPTEHYATTFRKVRLFPGFAGEMAEWLKAHAWKAPCISKASPWYLPRKINALR